MGEYDYALSDKMSDYLTNFAKCGDPNGEGLPRWNHGGKEVLMIDDEKIEMGKASKRKLWHSLICSKSVGE